MPNIINSVDYSRIKKTIIFLFVALILVSVLFYFRKSINNIPFDAIIVLILGPPIIWLLVLLLEPQLSIFEDKIEKESWISVIAKWKKIKVYPIQEIIIEKMWTTAENPISCYMILQKENGKKEYIPFYVRSYSELKNESKNIEKLGILQIKDFPQKDKQILTILSTPGLILLFLVGLFCIFVISTWLISLIS